MVYGSGKPAWAQGGDVEDGVPRNRGGSPRSPRGGGDNAGSGNSSGSYQRGGDDGNYGYKPPQVTGNYAEQQTQVVEDAARTHVEAETTANTVLAALEGQRHQLQNANDDTWAMRMNVANAQRELKELQTKAWQKRKRLYVIIGMLSSVDLLLFLRIVQCGGSFFCRRY